VKINSSMPHLPVMVRKSNAIYGIPTLIREGMPRILLSSAHIAPLVLDAIGFEHTQPRLAKSYPALPEPFNATADRLAKLQVTDTRDAMVKAFRERCELSAKKPYCDVGRAYIEPSPSLPSMQM
jgi:hypothetical protein